MRVTLHISFPNCYTLFALCPISYRCTHAPVHACFLASSDVFVHWPLAKLQWMHPRYFQYCRQFKTLFNRSISHLFCSVLTYSNCGRVFSNPKSSNCYLHLHVPLKQQMHCCNKHTFACCVLQAARKVWWYRLKKASTRPPSRSSGARQRQTSSVSKLTALVSENICCDH